jgi:glycosyltransferase involved in cell wall biosynthesis
MFNGKLALQQRVLPTYRAPLFDLLAQACARGLSVFAGEPRPEESIATTQTLRNAQFTAAHNLHILRGALYLCYQRGILRWLEAQNPDALIVEANPRYLSTPAAVRWMKSRNRPVVGWGLGAPPVEGWRRARRAQFLNSFDALIAYSRRGADQYAACGIPVDRIFVAPNAVAPRPQNPMPARVDHFTPLPVVLFVGRLQARKRIDHLLEACAALPETIQPRLVIVGDGPERAQLESMAKSVYPRAEFTGAVHGEALAPYFISADLFVLPGTGGLAIQEAMSYGLPVIVAQGDGTQDDLVRPANGWQIPPDDLGALRSALSEALSDAARLRGMGSESYRIVSEEINLEKMAGIFVAALNQPLT